MFFFFGLCTNRVIQILTLFIFSLLLLVPQTRADQQTDFDALLVNAEGVMKSYFTVYEQRVNYDGKYPLELRSPEDELNQVKLVFEKGTDNERSKLIERVAEGITSLLQLKEKYLLMSKKDIENERKQLQHKIDEDLAAAADEKARRDLAREKEREKQQINKSSPTYERERFRKIESLLFAEFKQRFNSDSDINIDLAYFGYFGYFPERLEKELDNANSQNDKDIIYREYAKKVKNIITDIMKMPKDQIEQHRKNAMIRNKHTKLIEEKKALESVIAPLIEKLTSLKDSLEDIPNERCVITNVDYDCGNRCEVMRKDPIFGTFKSDVDRQCMSSCRNQEKSKKAEFDREEADCFREQRSNIAEFKDLKRDYNSTLETYQRKQKRYDTIETEIQSILHSLKVNLK